ncbi:endonuclease Q family protein [Parapedobacter koreensis]|uniref:Metal binding domain of Ada n=1 Tax=Parapedobacter koreensis TaxID=332977 RepID=A0A1H7U4Z9_9SPHI|nr:endonuclease Q family protein [Parapedobacter koreensis]SEL91839.1 hypothetical protein SAMN05421740_11389 [Parapedobacter koreensis]
MYKRILYLFLVFGFLLPAASGVQGRAVAYTATQQKDTVVYITKTGAKYHRTGCRYLSRSQIKTTKKEAVKNGYGACKVCGP